MGSKGGRCVRLRNLSPSRTDCLESSCKLREAVQDCTGIAITLPALMEMPQNSCLFQGYGVLMIKHAHLPRIYFAISSLKWIFFPLFNPFLKVTSAVCSSLPSSSNLKQLPPSLESNVFVEMIKRQSYAIH